MRKPLTARETSTLMAGKRKEGNALRDEAAAKTVDAMADMVNLLTVGNAAMQRTITRIETRVVTGFTKLGVDPCSYDGADGLSFDSGTNTVYIRGAGTSVTDLLAFTATLDIPASRLRLKLLRASVAQE